MLSTSCKYALRASVYLMSRIKESERSGIREVAGEIGANEHTTAKILQQLVHAGILSSAKGPNGGFFIAPGKRSVFLIDIVRLIDGDQFFFECGLGLKECSEKKPCPIHHSYKAARQGLYHEFCNITIQELAANINKGMAFLKR